MTCPACLTVAANPVSGAYRSDCLHCNARLLAATPPQTPQAAAMLAFIERGIKRHDCAFSLDDVKMLARQMRTATRKARAALANRNAKGL